MSDDNDIKILDRLTAVNLNVSIWTARRKLTAEDFGGIELPPEELASLGSKKICDPERLRIFSTLKARAVNQLDRVGVRFLGGWAIPDEEAGSVLKTLQEVKSDFLEAKEDFLGGYDLAVKSWIDKHPGWERLIADSPVGADHVSKRLGLIGSSTRWSRLKTTWSGTASKERWTTSARPCSGRSPRRLGAFGARFTRAKPR